LVGVWPRCATCGLRGDHLTADRLVELMRTGTHCVTQCVPKQDSWTEISASRFLIELWQSRPTDLSYAASRARQVQCVARLQLVLFRRRTGLVCVVELVVSGADRPVLRRRQDQFYDAVMTFLISVMTKTTTRAMEWQERQNSLRWHMRHGSGQVASSDVVSLRRKPHLRSMPSFAVIQSLQACQRSRSVRGASS
jgi:hypothetical protein